MTEHGNEQPEDFIRTVNEIKTAEDEYERLIRDAKEKAATIGVRATEAISDTRKKSAEEMVAFKNFRLNEGTKELEKAVQKTIQKAKEDGQKISKKELGREEIAKIAREFLNNL